jgi:integrase
MRPTPDGPAPIGDDAPVWCYRPEGHKTEHHGIERRVYIGPRAQEVLRPYLDRDPEAYCFCPREGHAQDLAGLDETDFDQNKQPAPRFGRTGGRRYDKNSYRKAIVYGLCRLAKAMEKELPKPAPKLGPDGKPKKARWRPPTRTWFEANGVPYWHPSQIRHSTATQLELNFDHDTARVVLGHGDERTTRIYAERDFSKAAEAARQIG